MKFVLTLTFAESATPEQIKQAFTAAAKDFARPGDPPLVGWGRDLGAICWRTEAESARLERTE